MKKPEQVPSIEIWKHLNNPYLKDKAVPDEKLARAIGSRIHKDMLHQLTGGEVSMHRIADGLEISEVNASKHLKKLYDLGLIAY